MNKLTRKRTDKYLFESKNIHSTTFLLFTADWCDACKEMNSLFEEKSIQFKTKANFKKINVDDKQSDPITIQYKIVKIPTIIIIVKGKIKKYINKPK